MKYSVDKDKLLNYEVPSKIRVWMSGLFLFLLARVATRIGGLMVRKSDSARKVKERATTAVALEIIYNYNADTLKISDGFLNYLLSRFWFNINNARAVRNRLLLTKNKLGEFIQENRFGKIRVASLGSGSARAIIETVAEMEKYADFIIDLVDSSDEALRLSRDLVIKSKIKSSVYWHHLRLEDFLSSQEVNSFDIIEMVGILDYLSDARAHDVFEAIHKVLKPTGLFITANIGNNLEKVFVDKVMRWSMVYRTPKDLFRILETTSFNNDRSEVISEPIKIHHLLIARK